MIQCGTHAHTSPATIRNACVKYTLKQSRQPGLKNMQTENIHCHIPNCGPPAWRLAAFGTMLVLLTVWSPASRGGVAPPDDAHCLAEALYWEARGEPQLGMLAVGQVVLNRVKHRDFPDTVCQVVHQGYGRSACQFSYWCDGKSDKPTNERAWNTANNYAAQVLMLDGTRDITSGALFYHADHISPQWSEARERTVHIGRHIYYR